jgi:hypothetical protein
VSKPKSTAPKSSTSGTVGAASLDLVQDEDSEFPNKAAVGGMLEEDDSLEQAVAMSSPVKGAEFRAAQKVNFVFSLIEM